MGATGRTQAAAAVVRRLNAAVKSRRLYEAGHTLRTQTVSAFLATVSAYHERFGSFVLETHRKGLMLEGRPFEGGESVDNLALLLYSVGVWQLVLLPGITEPEASEFLDVVMLERDAILSDGGIAEILNRRGVQYLRVFELRPGEEESANISLEIYQELLDGSLQPHDRAVLLGLLRGGADQAQRLLSVIVDRTRQAFPDVSGAELSAKVYEALAALDRLIVDAPQTESKELLQNLANAVADLDESKRGGLHATILQRAAEDFSSRALLAAMTSEQIARIVIPCLEAGDSPTQVNQVVQGLPFDPAKARDTVALISQQTGRTFDLPALREELQLPGWIRDITQDLIDFNVTDAEVTVTGGELQALTAELNLDEPTLAREQVITLLHLCHAEDDPRELEANLAVLIQDTETLLQHSVFDVATTVLVSLERLGAQRGAKGEQAHAALLRLLVAIPGMVSVKDVWRWNDDHPLLICLREIGRTASATLAYAMATERDPGRRQVIGAVMSRLGDEHAEAVAQHLKDPHPEVVKQIVRVLAQMRSPKAFTSLRAIARHSDPDVRKDTVSVLGSVQTPAAQDALLAFLDDPLPQVQEAALGHLRAETAKKVAPSLIVMLQSRESSRTPSLRIRIIKTLSEINAVEAVPVLRRIGSRFQLRRSDREVARHARHAVVVLTRRSPSGTPLQKKVAS